LTHNRREDHVSDHDDDNPGDNPEPINLDAWRDRPDRTKEPIKDGFRVEEGTLFDARGKRRCSAKARNSPGGYCYGHPVKEQKRCRMHGGTSPKAKERAARDRTRRQMQSAVALHDMGPVHDPLTALKNLAGEVVSWKDAMREQVEGLNTLSYSTDYGETAKALVQLFERSMDRAADVLTKIARLNIDERLAAVTERQAKMIEDAFFSALDEAGIPPLDLDTREKVTVAYAKHLSVIPA
jgi:hypothetical protein